MFSQPGRVENTEEPPQVVPEPSKDLSETLGDFQPEPCTLQTTPVETSQLESARSQAVPTCDETAMTSESGRRASTQKLRAQPGKDMDFQLGEPSEAVALNQQAVSVDQTKKSPADSQQLKLNTQTSLPGSQRAVPDSQESVIKECSHLQIKVGRESIVIQHHRTSHSDNRDARSGGQRASSKESHVKSPSGDQTINEEGQQMPDTGDQTFDSSPRVSGMGATSVCCKRMMPFIMYVLDPTLHGLTFVDDTTGCTYKIPDNACCIQGNQKKAPKVKKTVSKHHERAHSSSQGKSSGQLVSSARGNVCPGEKTAPSDDGSQETQVVSGESSVLSPSPSAPRQPPEGISDSPEFQREGPQEKTDPEDQSTVPQKKPCI